MANIATDNPWSAFEYWLQATGRWDAFFADGEDNRFLVAMTRAPITCAIVELEAMDGDEACEIVMEWVREREEAAEHPVLPFLTTESAAGDPSGRNAQRGLGSQRRAIP